ncbi:hypothetical protein [Anthocerotibacter panamensis]|uniref:hypothetical protein n=1 Tax=Anthocerotibacter panamensis TaxID=2857077 RepID=UPI001C40433F|nr:hypothetical protein [Anthocerotibacter panamensis]
MVNSLPSTGATSLVREYLEARNTQEREDLLIRLGIHSELLPLDSAGHPQQLTPQQREIVTSYLQLAYGVNLGS